MKRTRMMWVGVLVVLGFSFAARAEDLFTYWTQLQVVNLTSNDIQVTKLNWKYLDKDKPHINVGDIIPMSDPNNPEQTPAMIGEVSRWSGGVDMEIWFKLLNNVGSKDCYLKIHNPYTGNNTITPSKTFPADQCPSMTPAGIPDSQPSPLYHNIELPSSGHKLALVALLAFQQLVPDEGADMSESDQNKAVDQSEAQVDQAEQDKVKFRQETGIYVP